MNTPLALFRLAVLVLLAASQVAAQSITNNSGVTTLTFDAPSGDLALVPDHYGDRVTGVVDAHGNRYGAGSGGTSNVTVEYGPAGSQVRKAVGPYATLGNVACQEDGDFGSLEIRLVADPGFQVALHRFDLAVLADDVMLPRVEVFGEYGAVLHAAEDVLVPGFGGNRTRLDFTAAPLVSGALTLRLDLSSLPNTDSHLVGIDNIAFSQSVGSGSGCPRPPRLTITPQPGGTVVLSWAGPGYHLETASELGGRWITVAPSSPVTVRTSGNLGLFRLACP